MIFMSGVRTPQQLSFLQERLYGKEGGKDIIQK